MKGSWEQMATIVAVEGGNVRRFNQGGSLAFLLFGLFMMSEASRLVYFTRIGPGPGFFPMWVGGILAVLAGSQLLQATAGPSLPLPADFVPGRSGVFRVLSIVAAVAVFGFLVNLVGFQLMMFAYLVFLLVALGRQNVALTMAISLAGSFGQYYLFKNWLEIDLPVSSLDLLRNLGL